MLYKLSFQKYHYWIVLYDICINNHKNIFKLYDECIKIQCNKLIMCGVLIINYNNILLLYNVFNKQNNLKFLLYT